MNSEKKQALLALVAAFFIVCIVAIAYQQYIENMSPEVRELWQANISAQIKESAPNCKQVLKNGGTINNYPCSLLSAQIAAFKNLQDN